MPHPPFFVYWMVFERTNLISNVKFVQRVLVILGEYFRILRLAFERDVIWHLSFFVFGEYFP